MIQPSLFPEPTPPPVESDDFDGSEYVPSGDMPTLAEMLVEACYANARQGGGFRPEVNGDTASQLVEGFVWTPQVWRWKEGRLRLTAQLVTQKGG